MTFRTTTTQVLFVAIHSAAAWVLIPAAYASDAQPPVTAELVEVQKIWDRAPHNAFTDLVRWRDRWYCGFREGQRHVGDRGKLRIITSADGGAWEPAALLEMDGYDLRDADLSIAPDGRLMVLGGAREFGPERPGTGTFVSFSDDGSEFTAPQLVIKPGRWLWRVAWHDGVAYGVSYSASAPPAGTSLLASDDGLKYREHVPNLLDLGRPTEGVIRFADDGAAVCLQRRDGPPPLQSAMLGVSRPPYREWQWSDLGRFFGGPNLIETPGGLWIAAGRTLEGGAATSLAYVDVDAKTLTPLLAFPSGGDTSYPGLVWHDDLLWASYYSSHEGRASIYLAKVRLVALTDGE